MAVQVSRDCQVSGRDEWRGKKETGTVNGASYGPRGSRERRSRGKDAGVGMSTRTPCIALSVFLQAISPEL